jgi:DNA-binding MarR family transcriptional regulator
MRRDIKDRVAENLLALMPLYHRHVLKTGPGISGIRIAQYRALGFLMKSGPHSMSEIGGHLSISRPSMTTLANTLIAHGWIERRNNPDDRRIITLSITPAGKKHLQHAFEVYRSDVKALISGLDEQDLQRLSVSLEELQQIFAKLK